MTKLIIFDLDGTLLDTLGDIASACNHALEMCGCPTHETEAYRQLVGRGISNLFKGALPEESRTEEMVEKMRTYFVPYYKDHICDLTKPYPGVERMLEELTDAGISMAIASNKFQAGTEIIVEKLLGKFNFVKILGQREGHPIKPDPKIIGEIMETVPGITSKDTAYCGDSDVDMMTGINAGVKTLGACWGFRGREELAAYSPALLAESPEEITAEVLIDRK